MSNATKLALFHYDGCGYCMRVRHAIADLGIEVTLINIHHDPDARAELLNATGRMTVPVLRITENGQVRFLPESRIIIAWLGNIERSASS